MCSPATQLMPTMPTPSLRPARPSRPPAIVLAIVPPPSRCVLPSYGAPGSARRQVLEDLRVRARVPDGPATESPLPLGEPGARAAGGGEGLRAQRGWPPSIRTFWSHSVLGDLKARARLGTVANYRYRVADAVRAELCQCRRPAAGGPIPTGSRFRQPHQTHRRRLAWRCRRGRRSSFVLRPSSFVLRPSSFALRP